MLLLRLFQAVRYPEMNKKIVNISAISFKIYVLKLFFKEMRQSCLEMIPSLIPAG